MVTQTVMPSGVRLGGAIADQRATQPTTVNGALVRVHAWDGVEVNDEVVEPLGDNHRSYRFISRNIPNTKPTAMAVENATAPAVTSTTFMTRTSRI